MESHSTILVVDDEPIGFDVIETILFNEEYELHYASSGAIALKRLENVLPDLILLDVMMPELDGIEVCRRIKTSACWRHIPIIMVTALSSKVVLSRCLELGADDFIDKPVNALELRARVRSMLRIKHQHDALQSLLQLRQDLTDMVVHDLRNPIASILLSSAVLKRTELQEKQQRKVEQIVQAGQRLQGLVDNLLLLAKLEAGEMRLERSPVDVCQLAGQAVADFQEIAASKHLTIETLLPDQSKVLALDGTLFRRVLDNLISNAIKFSPHNGQIKLEVEFPIGVPKSSDLNSTVSDSVTVSDSGANKIIESVTQATADPSANTAEVRIRVIDQGIGVKPDLREAIFQKYKVGRLVGGESQTGIGLAFCKMAIEAHRGKIFVEENFPQGAVFVIEI